MKKRDTVSRFVQIGMLAMALALPIVGQAEESGKSAVEAMGWGHGATLSPMVKAPILDGKLEPGEWERATGTINFLNTFGKEEPGANSMFMDLREGRTLCGFYGDTLYIAVVSALPPRGFYGPGKHSQVMPRDSALIGDFNAVEIWLDPSRDRRQAEPKDPFYQIFVNTVGSLCDAKIVPGGGMDNGWNADIQSASSIDHEKKVWTVEIAISLKSLGWPKDNLLDKSMGILVARNYKAPWGQATWFPHGGAFVDWYKYPRIRFTKDEPVVAITELGEKFWAAHPEFKVRIDNPGPARTAKVALHIKTTDMPDLNDVKDIALPANGAAFYTYQPGVGALHDRADHLFKLKVTDATGARSWFDYVGMWSRNPRTTVGSGAGARPARWLDLRPFEQKWEFGAEAEPANSVSLSAYPSLGRIRVQVDSAMLVADALGADKDKLSDSVKLTLQQNGAGIASTNLSWDLSNKVYTAGTVFVVPGLPEGDYVVSAEFNKHSVPIRKTYTRIRFPWEGSQLGVTETIYPPFTAVVASGRNTAVVGRNYGVGSLGLWNSIRSLDKEILAGPMVLKVKSGKEEILTGVAKLVKSTPMSAVYEAEAKHPAVTVKSVCTTEIDGCMKVELTLLPPDYRSQNPESGIQNAGVSTNNSQPTTLNSLVLEIPLQDKMVPLWHACTTALRVNPAGETPQGDGVVWDSRKFPNGDWIGNFTPYIWLGGVERGLAVFGNNDKGWVLNWNQKKEFSPCQELIRNEGVLTLRLNLVQKPVVITEPRTIVLGFMASPGKPMPYKDWRSIAPHCGNTLGKGFEHLPSHFFDMGWAVEEVFNAAYPYNRDYSIYDAKMMIAGTPGGDMVREKGWGAFLDDWKKRNGLDKPVDQLAANQKYAIGRADRPCPERGKIYNCNYWDEYHNDSSHHPETKVYNGEWGRNNMASSRLDFRCYHAAEVVKRGVGLFLDNAFPQLSKDLVTSDAYEIPGLGIQGSAGLWERRTYHRRLWNIFREYGAKWNNKPMQAIHMTNTGILPMLTWNDLDYDLEWYYGPGAQQSKYNVALLQAETCGRQFGTVPYALARINECKTPADQRLAERTKFGVMMTHEIRFDLAGSEIQKLARIWYGFGYGLSGLFNTAATQDTVYNYWDDDYPAVCDKSEVKSILVKRGEELMLLVCSWNKDPVIANFTFNKKALGLDLFAAKDAEGTAEQQVAALKTAGFKPADLPVWTALVEETARRPIEFNARQARLTVGLDGYGVRMVRLK